MSTDTLTEAPTTASKLAALQSKAAPLSERLAKVDGSIADLSEVIPQGDSLDEQIKARQAAAAKVADLKVERDVVCQRLEPILIEIAELEKLAKDERVAANLQRSVTTAREALDRVAAAREALHAEIAAMGEAGKFTPIPWRMVPEVHFAVQEEIARVIQSARLLNAAAV